MPPAVCTSVVRRRILWHRLDVKAAISILEKTLSKKSKLWRQLALKVLIYKKRSSLSCPVKNATS